MVCGALVAVVVSVVVFLRMGAADDLLVGVLVDNAFEAVRRGVRMRAG